MTPPLPFRLVPCLCLLASTALPAFLHAQSVCLPAPRLLTTMPMGGQAGTELEVTISGQSLEGTEQLIFSNPSISATPKLKDDGTVEANQFLVRIAPDCAPGVYDARIMAGLGISSARAFSVSNVPEVTQTKPSTSLDTALEIAVGSIVNATLVDRSVNFYAFDAKQDQRIIVDCVAKGIDSKMNPVLVVADASGSDLIVERRGGIIDFTAPAEGRYVIKVHDLTFKGGPYYFFRLALTEVPKDVIASRLPATRSVTSFSWPPPGLDQVPAAEESQLTANDDDAIGISLPCDISGSFYPAADVDTYQFAARKGETWWVEIASERLGHPTDPSVVVQRVVEGGDVVDVVELADVPSPVKRSSNGYSYDGPPYNAGSSDAMGKFEVPQDGTYRIRVTDLFGGTRNDPSNRYRMIVRKAAPDFALVGWALHMGLRNGDRNALSKPIALRGGAVMPLEIVVVRRDGFDGEIELFMENLPEGVTATGLKIAAGATRGIMLVSAADNAPRGLQMASLFGRASVDGQDVVRHCKWASMKWPVTNAKSEIPDPRLVNQIPVSVGGIEQAGLSIEPAEDKVWQVTAGEKLTIPLRLIRRGEFSGKTMSLQTFGAGFDRNAALELSLTDDQSEAVLDLTRLKPAPGEYTIAFYGGAVAKYAYGDAKPKDIVDIYVSKPISIHVVPAEATK
ncbi:PPC domain-containing protein [Stieleria sp. ICT_E10.1]|uniref:PPC domain-containing protein n=1 Tax=Stieleria sedimenti TaxID=2976331 RepID=UPI00217FBB8C|nr:PPC domain-containing protein [Stieleria sedimenti]MCS7465410.1 PPC domain-containing protein [Stieleria sedimenti]